MRHSTESLPPAPDSPKATPAPMKQCARIQASARHTSPNSPKHQTDRFEESHPATPATSKRPSHRCCASSRRPKSDFQKSPTVADKAKMQVPSPTFHRCCAGRLRGFPHATIRPSHPDPSADQRAPPKQATTPLHSQRPKLLATAKEPKGRCVDAQQTLPSFTTASGTFERRTFSPFGKKGATKDSIKSKSPEKSSRRSDSCFPKTCSSISRKTMSPTS